MRSLTALAVFAAAAACGLATARAGPMSFAELFDVDDLVKVWPLAVPRVEAWQEPDGYNMRVITSDSLSPSYVGGWRLFNVVGARFYHSRHVFVSLSEANADRALGDFMYGTGFDGIHGVVVSVDMGRPIFARRMKIAPRSLGDYPTLNFLGGAPGVFRVYASARLADWATDAGGESEWELIHNQTFTEASYTYGAYTEFGLDVRREYLLFKLVVSRVTGGYGHCMFTLRIVGSEV